MVTLAGWIQSRAVARLTPYWFLSLPLLRMSSMGQTTLGRPSRVSLMHCWKCSVALNMPNGILLKQNQPKGVMKVVSRWELSEGWFFQNPLLASSLLKIFVATSCVSISSTFGSAWVSRRTCALSGLRFTQMHTVPSCFGTTTIPAHHGVGTCTLKINPKDSILFNSSLTFLRRGRGTL